MIRSWLRSARLRKMPRSGRPQPLPLRSGADLLETQAARLARIRREAGVPAAQWRSLYRVLLESFAVYVQSLPAATGGSLLEARLDAVSHALALRRRCLHSTPGPDEDVADRHGVWTFVAVASALLRDLGRDVLAHRVELCDDKGRKLGEWEPWAGPVSLRAAKSLRLRARHAPLPRLATLLPAFVASAIVPEPGMRLICADAAALDAWLRAICGTSAAPRTAQAA